MDGVQVVDDSHNHRNGGAKPEFRLIPAGVARFGDRGHKAPVARARPEARIDDLHRPPVLVEVRVAAVAREALPHGQASSEVATHDELLLPALPRRLHAMRAQAVQAEPDECLITQLVGPILVDVRVDVAELLHDILHGVLAILESLEAVGHGQVAEVVSVPQLEGKPTLIALAKLLLPAVRDEDVDAVVHLVLGELRFLAHLAHRHGTGAGVRQLSANQEFLEQHEDDLGVQVRVPVPRVAVPEKRPRVLEATDGAQGAVHEHREAYKAQQVEPAVRPVDRGQRQDADEVGRATVLPATEPLLPPSLRRLLRLVGRGLAHRPARERLVVETRLPLVAKPALRRLLRGLGDQGLRLAEYELPGGH
mmetsp:Transcript_39020/g.112705  ORF Transcript_39020/g.112705 Transcript_39020/m.112705 type:complete len:365 (-) Transcript_39020:221-1315(-)